VNVPAVRFDTIDLARDADTCVAFRRDSYVCSFGTDQRFVSTGNGIEGYLEFLRERIARFPQGHVHVRQGSEIVGQMEMRTLDDEPPTGYVNLFYLVPAARGSGLGSALQQYAREFFRSGGARLARLSVSPSNHRAVAYYLKHSWRALGPSPHDASCLLLERLIEA
jgi:ribosomal protein S18 acetylase RimI-like enzyme